MELFQCLEKNRKELEMLTRDPWAAKLVSEVANRINSGIFSRGITLDRVVDGVAKYVPAINQMGSEAVAISAEIARKLLFIPIPVPVKEIPNAIVNIVSGSRDLKGSDKADACQKFVGRYENDTKDLRSLLSKLQSYN